MPRNALISPVSACGSSIAVAMRSSRLMSSMSKALRIWVQPALQQPGDLLLVLCAVELGLHRIRRGRDLTERQRGRENLDEERFHLASWMLKPEAGYAPPLSHRYKMAFWGVPFLIRANIVRGCSPAPMRAWEKKKKAARDLLVIAVLAPFGARPILGGSLVCTRSFAFSL